ncbi:unnamed protein product [Ectocarpus sp. 4 AP-2014]
MGLKYLAAAAVAVCCASHASACSCMPIGALCDSIQNTDVILHVSAVSWVDGEDINSDDTYTLETIEVFKAEDPGPNEYDEVGSQFEITTAGNSGLCGVYMDADGSTEYLIDLNRQSDGSLRAAGICGVFREWDEADRAELEEGCDDYDPCNGECGEFQVCSRSYFSYSDASYFCSDTCDPSPCSEGEECTLTYPFCSASDVCGPVADCGEGVGTPGPASTPLPETAPPIASDEGVTLPPANEQDDQTTESPSPAPTGVEGEGRTTPSPALGSETGTPGPSVESGTPATTTSPAPVPSPSGEDGSRGDVTTTTPPSSSASLAPSTVADTGDAPAVPDGTSSPTTDTNTGGTDGAEDASGAAPAAGLSCGGIGAVSGAAAAAWLFTAAVL